MRVAIFGLGYVGSVSAACLASVGHDVVGVDLAQGKVDMVRAGRAPLAEPGLAELMREAVAAGTLTATTDADEALRGTDVAIICVGTPSAPHGSLATNFVETVVGEIAAFLAATPEGRHLTVAFRSTLLPGTTDDIVGRLMPERGERYSIAYCPEFLRESSAIADFRNPPFTIVGTDDPRALAALGTLFAAVDAPITHVSVPTAEGIKYASNAFHAVKIAFANEIARFSDAHGVDAHALMRVFVQDHILNISERYLRPGFSFGGSCLPKDVRALTNAARKADVDVPLLDSLLPSNRAHTQRLIDHVLAKGWRRIALFGLAFKSGTDDLRESPYVDVAETLTGKGVEVRIYDDVVRPEELVGSNESYIMQRLPHLARLLHISREAASAGVDGVIVGSDRTPPDMLATLTIPVINANEPAARWR